MADYVIAATPDDIQYSKLNCPPGQGLPHADSLPHSEGHKLLPLPAVQEALWPERLRVHPIVKVRVELVYVVGDQGPLRYPG